jgi:glutamyl-tRNA synthetase
MLSEDIIKEIRKQAIKNAIDYGKANPDNVFPKVVRSVQKDQIKELRAETGKIVEEVNSLTKDELDREYEQYRNEFDEKYNIKVEATSKPRMELEGAVDGAFVTRWPPEPSGYMYLGHAKPAFLEQEFSRIYHGKLLLYFDDSNPEKEKQEYVDMSKRDLDWLGFKFDGEYYASDNLDKIYEYGKKIISIDRAYACKCTAEQTKKERFDGIECVHRDTAPEENLKEFDMMLANKYEEGAISIRFKGDMKSNNTALRDPTIFRIKKDSHYRQGTKYVVWPTYDFNTPINDSIHGITDVIRSKEYELRDELYDMILDLLGMRKPRIHSEARLIIKGQPASKRYIRKLIDDGLIGGYDDPRLVTIIALKRRGIQPDAIRKFALSFGMSKTDGTVTMEPLLAENKRIIDKSAKRLYYVPAPVDIIIKDFDSKRIELGLHPSDEDMGSRQYLVGNKFYISGEDAAEIKDNDIITLKNLFTIKVRKEKDSLVGEIVENKQKGKIVQWVSEDNYVKCKILVPGDVFDDNGDFRRDSLRVNQGYVENFVTELADSEIVQFERFGFCILDNREEMRFIFISK